MDELARNMAVTYSSLNKPDITVGIMLPKLESELDEYVKFHAPISQWIAKEKYTFVPTVGYTKTVSYNLASQQVTKTELTTLVEVQDLKMTEIDRCKEKALIETVTVNGNRWQSDQKSIAALTTAITIANNGGKLPSVWRNLNDQNIPITKLSDLTDILNAIGAQLEQVNEKSWNLKDLVLMARNKEQVADIKW